MVYLDTETCGYHGPIITIQYSFDEGPIVIHEVWNEPVMETMSLIERIVADDVCAFNLVFDWFHICQLYTMLRLVKEKRNIPIIEEMASVQREARDGPCLKPRGALDLLLVARKGKYQSTMDRKPIYIRRVPNPIAEPLARELENRIKFRDIYFARRKKKALKWRVKETKDPEFKDLVLEFKASSALKNIVKDALGFKDVLKMEDVEIPKEFYPEEYGYAPTEGNWPEVISKHITHWQCNEKAREYAEKDVFYLKELYKFFGKPEINDTDSILAAMVGAVRWKGYKVDLEKIKELKKAAKGQAPLAPSRVKRFLHKVMDDFDIAIMGDGTDKETLKTITGWTKDDEPPCDNPDCKLPQSSLNLSSECKGSGTRHHPAAKRAYLVLDARAKKKETELYDKLLLAGRLHASFKVIGTLSTRMSGADGLNPQAIKRTKSVRDCFPFCEPPMLLCGGDFDAFEVSIADAVYSDENMTRDLKSGRSIHAVFGTFLFPGKTYEEIMASKGTRSDSMYDISKNCVFTLIYGAEAYTINTKYKIPIEIAEKAVQEFFKTYPGISRGRRIIEDKFQSMIQPGGIGTEVIWKEPDDFVASLFGFKRYFTLENRVTKALFEMARVPPKSLQGFTLKVKRRERVQTASGAVQSALYACAFSIQGANKRAAGNHVVQSSGATITKTVQRAIWDHQPIGISDWVVQPCNVHDEILCPVKEGHEEAVKETVESTIHSLRSVVPLLGMKWKKGMKSWAEK